MRTRIALVSLLLRRRWDRRGAAHAFLDHASPLVGSTVPAAPHEVSLSFTQSLEPAFSTVRSPTPRAPASIRARPQVSGNTMRVGLKALAPGRTKFTGTRSRSTRTRRKAVSTFQSAASEPHGRARSVIREARLDDPLIYARAIHFAATFAVVGAIFFIVFIAEPAFHKSAPATRSRRRFARSLPGSPGSALRAQWCPAPRGSSSSRNP